MFSTYQFSQLIEDPTRITETSKTLIDVAFTTNADRIVTSGFFNCSINDHRLVYIVRRARIPRGEINTVRCRRFNNYSSQTLADDLHSASWKNIDTSITINEAWMPFKRTFMKIADKHAPFMTMRIRSSTLPWLNENIRNLIKVRNFYHKKAQKSGFCNDWAIYRAIRNKVVSQIRYAKRNYYSNLVEENKNDSGKLWNAMKSAISSGTRSSQIVVDGYNITEHKMLSSHLAPFFKTIIGNLREGLLRDSTYIIPTQTRLPSSFKLSQIEPDFFKKHLKSLKVKKSTGVPGLQVRLLKDGSDAISEPLTLPMNRSLREGYLPDEWKHALVTPVCKAGHKSDPSNYRPLSVLPVFSKILERGVHKIVYDHLQLNNLLFPSQSGFRPLHSTSTCLTHVTNTLLENID